MSLLGDGHKCRKINSMPSFSLLKGGWGRRDAQPPLHGMTRLRDQEARAEQAHPKGTQGSSGKLSSWDLKGRCRG